MNFWERLFSRLEQPQQPGPKARRKPRKTPLFSDRPKHQNAGNYPRVPPPRDPFTIGTVLPFGDYYAPSTEEVFRQDEKEHRVDDEGWFDVFGELPQESKEEFVDWWYEHAVIPGTYDIWEDFPYTWEDFREKYGD